MGAPRGRQRTQQSISNPFVNVAFSRLVQTGMRRKAILLIITLLTSFVVSGRSDPSALTERQKALHALNRLAFGPRPGEVERVMAMGVEKWIELQLRPEKIADAAVERQLASLQTLAMSSDQMFETFERPILEARQRMRREGEESEAGEPAEMAARMRDQIPPERRPRRVVAELNVAKIVRAVESERQLNEVMADFWMNHFNVAANKGQTRVLVTSYERDVIRPHMWGNFEELLMATAKAPAMLFYLDNARSVATEENRPSTRPQAYARRRSNSRPVQQQQRNGGLNENYARELLELHTLGVDGGYTQKDVTEVARLFTGWSIRSPRKRGRLDFIFRAGLHDSKPKSALGQQFPAGGGIDEGERMIRFLAQHPSTARNIATKLCQRLVSDDPPSALVERVAKRFLDTKGNLRETVRAVITSPEFFDPQYYRVKVKTPFEYAVSAIRAVDGKTDGRMIARELQQMGQPLYLCQPPTGYSDAAADWVSSGALLARMNFGIALAGGRLPGTRGAVERHLDGDPAVERMAMLLIGGDLSAETRETINQRMEEQLDERTRVALTTGLILGSPEFQRQ